MYNAPLCVLDVETGGSDAEKNPITEFACIIIDPFTLEERGRYETYVKNYNNLVYDEAAMQYTGITMQDLEDGVEGKELVKNIIELCKEHKPKGKGGSTNPHMVGHNIGFDEEFLFFLFQCFGKNLYDTFSKATIDTMMLGKLAWAAGMEATGKTSLKLSSCLERADIEIVQAHSAMGDVEPTVDLLRFFQQRLGNEGGGFEEVSKGTAKQKSRAHFQI